MSVEIKELIAACENVLGFFVGEKYEQKLEAEDRPPIVPARFRGVAAEQVMLRLNLALKICKEKQQMEELSK